MAAAVTAATRERFHLAADTFAQRYVPARRALIARLGALAGLAPWALFVLYASRQGVWMSLSQLESFPDTYNPGYFLVKLALWVLRSSSTVYCTLTRRAASSFVTSTLCTAMRCDRYCCNAPCTSIWVVAAIFALHPIEVLAEQLDGVGG